MLLAISVTVPSLGGWETLLRLAVAGGLGAAVGVERELRDREAGIRTHLLVAMGACLFTIVSAYGFEDVVRGGRIVADPTRIAAQIVSGIGFLGAGAIIREGISIRGLTTAGSLWVVAAVGMAVGAGAYWPAVAGTLLTLFALWPMRYLAYQLLERVHPPERRLVIELGPGGRAAPLLDELDAVHSIEIEQLQGRRVLTVDLAAPVGDAVLSRLADLEGVLAVRWRR